MNFSDLQLDAQLLNAVERLGFEEPTEIQAQAIPHILSSTQDLIALAQTGTGKTGAFSPLVCRRSTLRIHCPQLLILAPTRELALQIARDVKKFSKFKRGLKSVAVYGGADVHTQARALKNGCQVVVGTPGRTSILLKGASFSSKRSRWLCSMKRMKCSRWDFKRISRPSWQRLQRASRSCCSQQPCPRALSELLPAICKNPTALLLAEKCRCLKYRAWLFL